MSRSITQLSQPVLFLVVTNNWSIWCNWVAANWREFLCSNLGVRLWSQVRFYSHMKVYAVSHGKASQRSLSPLTAVWSKWVCCAGMEELGGQCKVVLPIFVTDTTSHVGELLVCVCVFGGLHPPLSLFHHISQMISVVIKQRQLCVGLLVPR
jgi:hypothetical protein